MRVILPLILLFILTNSIFAQVLSEAEFENRFEAASNEVLNVSYMPQGFKDCAYTIYSDNPGLLEKDGFQFGRIFASNCFSQHATELTFSDGGERMRDIMLSFTEGICFNQNKQYNNQIDVRGYCSCITNYYEENDIPIEAMLNPDLIPEKEYMRVANKCIEESQY